MAEATPMFKELGLTQTQAQKLVDLYSKIQIANHKASMDAVTAMRSEWRDQVMKSDLGPKLDAVKADIGKALTNVIKDPVLIGDFKKAMDLTGAGDNPAFIKIFAKFADAVNEGTHVTGQAPSPLGQQATGRVERPSMAQAMYPNLPS